MPPNSSGAVVLGERSALDLPWQIKAWRFYGTPDGTAADRIRTNRGANGEVRFVMGWIAQQIARVGWIVEIDGKRLTREESAELMLQVSNEQSTIMIATNLIVAGELNYIALSPDEYKRVLGAAWSTTVGAGLPGTDDKLWMPVSVVDNYRMQLFEAAQSGLNIRGLWPHPAKPISPDPPLAAVLDILEEIEQLQDLAYSQNRSRIANMGILTIANDLELANTLPNGRGSNTGAEIEAVINAPLRDPRKTSAAPIIFRAPMEYVTGALSNGARAVQWTRPDLDYAESIESRMKFAIQRLAWGFPLAPEILLGMTATNRAVAFQVEESTYRSHVEPIADLVGRVYAAALRAILEGEQRVEVLPDATDLLARRHSIADAKDLYDRGLVRASYVRRVAGVEEEEAATDEDIERILRLRKGNNQAPGREMDPSEVAGNEPVRASAAIQSNDLRAALKGAIDMAQIAAISRVGAQARTRLSRIPSTPALELDPEAVPNQRLPSLLGVDRLSELNLDLSAAIGPASEWLVDWLEDQLASTDLAVEERFGLINDLRAHFKNLCTATSCTWPITKTPEESVDALLAEWMPQALAVEGGG